MRRATIIYAVLGLAGAARADAPPSPLIYPPQKLPLSFSHAEHAARGLACGACHAAATTSTRTADALVPGEDACVACHAVDRAAPDKSVAAGEPPAACAACHPAWTGAGAPPRVVIPVAAIKLNHKLHADRGIDCQACHGDIAATGLATRMDLPKMATCLHCHDGAHAAAACTTCHVGDRDGRMQTDFAAGRLVPSGSLRGDAHDLRFRTDHAAAGSDDRYCANCHTRSFCVDCHQGVVKPIDIHGGDYIHLHTIDARRSSTNCQACHRVQTFCVGCHARSGVSDDGRTSEYQLPSKTPGATNTFHPTGWWTTMDKDMRSGLHHSFQAERSAATCASCHREGFCIGCHGSQVNPHPPGWAASARCRALASRAGRTCRRCHTRAEDAKCD